VLKQRETGVPALLEPEKTRPAGKKTEWITRKHPFSTSKMQSQESILCKLEFFSNLLGDLFGEAKLLSLAKAYQDSTGFHLKHPGLAR